MPGRTVRDEIYLRKSHCGSRFRVGTPSQTSDNGRCHVELGTLRVHVDATRYQTLAAGKVDI